MPPDGLTIFRKNFKKMDKSWVAWVEDTATSVSSSRDLKELERKKRVFDLGTIAKLIISAL